MNVNLINDIINDYSKLYDELYKKRYSSLNQLLDKSKQELNIIKEKISSNQLTDEQNKDEILSENTKNLITCIKDLLENKLNKYIIDFLNILKKCIQYKLWSKLNSHPTIDLMKEIISDSKINTDCLNKIVEVIHAIIFTPFFELNEIDAINIYLINIKTFIDTNNYQNYNFKNPIRLLFIALTDIVYKSNNKEIIINITKFLFSLYIKDETNSNSNNNDNEYSEIIKEIKNNVHIKCLSLELLSQGLTILKEKNININNLEEFIKNKILLAVKNSLTEIKKRQINNDQEYIHFLKLFRIIIIIICNYKVDYDIISLIITFLNEEINIQWQKSLSMECLQEILNNNLLIINIYNYNKEIILDIFITLGSVYEQNKTSVHTINKTKAKKQNKKQIEKNIIYLQGDEKSIIKESEIFNNNIINNIKECIQNTINSFSCLIKEYKIPNNIINVELSKEQEIIKEIASFSSNYYKLILFDLIDLEYNHKEFEELDVQKTINYMQNLIIIYSSLNMIDIRDEYLNKICQLCTEFNNEKNIIVCSSILSLSKFIQFFNKTNFVLIFQTIEKIYIKYNDESKDNYDFIIEDIFKSYKTFYSGDHLVNKEVEYKNEKKEKENLLISTINSMFIDSKSINISILKEILESLIQCLQFEINGNHEEKENSNQNEIIIFYLTKLLTLTLLNIENIYYIYDDYILPIIDLLKQKKILLNFIINLISSLIKEILLNHQKIISNLQLDKNNNNWLLNQKWQKRLFESLVSFVLDQNLINLTKNRLLICITAIVQQNGNYIDLFGWESIFKICQLLVNDNIEEIFFIIKLILTDYNAYLTIFNVMPIITLLGIFISYQKDKNICFNSIELFWSCANIVEKFHKGKIDINESQKKIFEELLKEEKTENFDIFYSGLYYKIFSQLLRINSDFRYDIRKNGINIFTEIFVSKINSIEYANSLLIIKDIFFNIFVINSKKYIDKEKSLSNEDKEISKQINLPQKKENELEQTLHASLLSMIKILKSLANFNIDKKSDTNSLENIFTSFLMQLKEIITFGTISLNSDILHGLSEIKNIKNNNKILLPSKLDVFFEIMDKFQEFINSARFTLTPYNKMKCLKMLNNLINILNDIFCNELNYGVFNIQINEIFNKIFAILEFILTANSEIEKKNLEYSPQKLTLIEENIFGFIQNIPIVNEQIVFNYILKNINYDIKDIHSGAKCTRAIECLIYIIKKSEGNCFILKENNKKFLYLIFEKYLKLFDILKNDNIKQYLIKNNNQKKCEIMFNYILKQVSQFFLILINKIQINYEEVLIKIIEFYQIIYEKMINELKLINDISFIEEIKDIYYQMFQIIITSLFLELSPLIHAILYEKENNLKNIEYKLLRILFEGCYKINENTKDNINKFINESINKLFLKNLFTICKYQSNQEILEIINKSKLKNIQEKEFIQKYIHFKIECISLLIS